MLAFVRQGLNGRAVARFAILAALVLGSTALPTPLRAISGSGCKGGLNVTTIYFSDASKTTVVGHYHTDCAGVCTGSGTITSFYELATTNVVCNPRGGA